ncbi:MAG: hypothetical protein JWP62_3806 [Blastococcus sp.]|jgi:hypothetical protein|nr:hypothetical protein [Blastococcus sp.]
MDPARDKELIRIAVLGHGCRQSTPRNTWTPTHGFAS